MESIVNLPTHWQLEVIGYLINLFRDFKRAMIPCRQFRINVFFVFQFAESCVLKLEKYPMVEIKFSAVFIRSLLVLVLRFLNGSLDLSKSCVKISDILIYYKNPMFGSEKWEEE